MSAFPFEVVVRVDSANGSSRARIARFGTPHGEVETPAFMPVATQGAVKGVLSKDLRELGTQILLSNAYHLVVRPGSDVVRALGGLHEFMNWDGPILTDSGGFQVLSLAELRKIDDEGVAFQSHVDGAHLHLDPETILDREYELGTDVAMVLDHCPGPDAEPEEQRAALERTIRWARRSAEHRDGLAGRFDFQREPMAVFAIGQGGPDPDRRAECAERLVEIDQQVRPFDGFAVGGVSVGEDRDALLETIPWGARGFPEDRPRYLMGVAGFEEFVVAIDSGIDLFDCVLPTRNARNGNMFRSDGSVIRLKHAEHREVREPIEPGCPCPACVGGTSRGFLHHAFKRGELVAYTLASQHNLWVFHRFLDDAREAIRGGRWAEFRDRWIGHGPQR